MSYDIDFYRRKQDIPTDEPREEKPRFTEEEIAIMEQHSNTCGEFDYEYSVPFLCESCGLNITFNLCEMFNWALNGNSEKYWVDVVQGKKCSTIIPKLKKAVGRMERYPKRASKYDSPNGWGTYPNALRFLKDLLAECVYYKDYYLYVSK